ncbi:hypothetical protein D6111_04415 [Lactococcus lactis]|nr:hypothetical protein QI18_04610 [Lactococcus lactis subsp. lactis]RQD99941.1 hypothetical protein D6109_06935 [Lactococcus lactis]MCT0031930.1 hypothetical protein [Lactococcus lactis subsp. lactis]MCT0067683.1 hypothetical protein [Lactococcus lactis subsp. lactis]RQE03307.1 hypothetical protein D6107_08015 [Lactococcus lactis]
MMTEEENNLVIEIGIDLMNFIGNSFDKANDITELKSVLKGLGFEDKKDISFDINDVYYQKKDGKNIWECKQFDPLSGGVYIFEIFFKKKTKEDFKKMWNKRASEIYEKTSENGTTKQVKNAIPQYNEQSSENYLYVGSHRTDINSRLKQHFGNNINSTSALKLTDEDIKNEIGNYNITCHRFILSDDLPEYARAGYIAMIEGILHEKLKPILGKK